MHDYKENFFIKNFRMKTALTLLSANVVYVPRDAAVTCGSTGKIIKNV